MKVKYKFVQKFTFMADRPQEGEFVMYRKLEAGMWKSKFALSNNNEQASPFLDFAIESDRKTKLHALFNIDEDNKWELNLVRVPGKSIAIDFIVNGKKWTGVGTIDIAAKKLNLQAANDGKNWNLDFDLNPAGDWGLHLTGDVEGPIDARLSMKKDFKEGELVVKYKGQSYAFVKMTGNAEFDGIIPKLFDFKIKYNINDGHDHQGKAKMLFNGKAAAKKFEMNFAPKTGKGFDWDFDFDTTAGFKYDSDVKVDGVCVEKFVGDIKWTNDNTKFELISAEKWEQTKESPFFGMNTFLSGGIEWTSCEETRNFFVDKVNKEKFYPLMKLEGEVKVMGSTYYSYKYDNTVPKVVLQVTYVPAPQYMTQWATATAWNYEGSRQHTTNGGIHVTHKLMHGECMIHDGEVIVDIKDNSAAKLELDYTHKFAIGDEAFHTQSLLRFFAGKYAKAVERKMTVLVFKKQKSIVFVPKMKVTSLFKVDGVKNAEFVFDNTQAKRTLKYFWTPDMYTNDHQWEQHWTFYPAFAGMKLDIDYKRGGASIYNYEGDHKWSNTADKFEIKTLEKVVQTEESPFYYIFAVIHGKYFKTGDRVRTITYHKKNRNFLLGKFVIEGKLTLDGKRHAELKVNTMATPYTFLWFHPATNAIVPSTQSIFGQEEITMNAWHTAGKELKVETNLPALKAMKITNTGITKKFELNGKELTQVDYDSAAKKASHTVHLPNGKDVIVSVAWPKITADASDLEFGVTITPDRKVVAKFGWAFTAINKVYLDIVGNNPWMGDYKLSRKGEFQAISPSQYKWTWLGHSEVARGGFHMLSPIETHMVGSVDIAAKRVDANMWKVVRGKKWGFTMANDKFFLLTGQ
jgi:hypothetical protein